MQSEKDALTDGLLFGSDAGFSPELTNLTRAAGVSHLVAASGSNLHFVTSLWNAIFSLLGSRFVQYSSVIAIFAYWHLAEQSGSLWRASGMWVFTWLGRLLGRKISLWYSLGLVCLTTWIGWKQFFSPGFWLSLLAILGVSFSQKLLSGEKKSSLFPQRGFYSNSVALSLTEGSIIFGMVTLWLWPQYEVFQPIGILSTWVLGMWVEPLVWLGMGERAASFLPAQLQKHLGAVISPPQELLFATFFRTLEFLAGQATQLPRSFLALFGIALTFRAGRRWRRAQLRRTRWKRLHV